MISRRWFWLVYGAILVVATVAGTEFVASFLAPPWPARDLRPVSAEALKERISSAFIDMPQLVPVYNDWGMRDRPRTFTRPPDVKFRSVMVGDSFLEGLMLTSPMPARVEKLLHEGGHAEIEAINLGVTATGPRQYYYRIRNVVTPLKPDVIVVVVYAGNDFVPTPLEPYSLPPWLAELPMPSVLGMMAPRTAWLLVASRRPSASTISSATCAHTTIPTSTRRRYGRSCRAAAIDCGRLFGHVRPIASSCRAGCSAA
ncbi:hypothetical protein [Reyranella sp.]|uniref:hypothetical protein n=1 Tax=Reyranella sp. TaxID=1929291 RepID=UPI0037841BBC